MRIPRFRMLGIVASVAIASSVALAVMGSGGTALGAATTLTVLAGEVSVRHPSDAGFVPAADGATLRAGEVVRTGAAARAVITYFEGSTVTLEPDTTLVVDAAEARDGGTVVLMTQLAGRTWHVVTKLASPQSRYEVRTPASTASVRGTEFVVDAGADHTTVTTTEGVVVAAVADPTRPGGIAEVPVVAGTTQTQRRGAPPAPAVPAPAPERTVRVTVGASSSLVVDPLGRTNGVTRDGKLVAQTPGARVGRDPGGVVIELPDMPDGTLVARSDDAGDGASVEVRVRVEGGGRSVELRSMRKRGEQSKRGEASKRVAAGFEIRRDGDGEVRARVLTPAEVAALPRGKATAGGREVRGVGEQRDERAPKDRGERGGG